MKFLKLFLFPIVLFLGSFAEASESWVEYQSKRIQAISGNPSSEEVKLLATLATNDPVKDSRDEIREIAWQRLLAIPDFPERLVRGIKEARDRWQSGEMAPAYYDSERVRFLLVMAKIKHPGMVAVLGPLLDDWEWPGWKGDPKQRNPFEGAEDGPHPFPNGKYAARALSEIIEHPPVQESQYNYGWDEVEIWQLWYAQVKAGTRTFRIKGDPTDYKLKGSAVVAVSTAAETTPPRQPVAAAEEKPGTPKTTLPLAMIIGACGIFGLAVFAVLRSKRGKPV